GGDASALYASIRKLLSLPPDTRLFMCHDYPPDDRPVAFETTVAEQRAKNIHVHDGVSLDDFVAMRTRRDATLDMPTLILPAVQINIRAGGLPPSDENVVGYLKIPFDALCSTTRTQPGQHHDLRFRFAQAAGRLPHRDSFWRQHAGP